MVLDLIGYLLEKIFWITIIMFGLLSMDNNQDVLTAAALIILTYVIAAHSNKKGEPA